MNKIVLCLLICTFAIQSTNSQTRKIAVIGSSTAAGLATSSPDSSWTRRISNFYKNQSGVLDTLYNLGVSGTNLYHGMPDNYMPPPGRPSPNPLYNVSQAHRLLLDVPIAANGVVIINYPSGGYDTYSIAEVLAALQLQYDSATRTGNRCFVTTTQPRTDAGFKSSAVKRKLAILKDSIINRFGVANTLNFWDGMYNPADTTILAAYSAGDSVHFNNAGHRVLFERVRAKNILNLPPVSYRSNVNPAGFWNDASSWQVFSGGTWITATTPPSMGSGSISILASDSIRISVYTEIDELIIEPGGTLSIFNTTGTPPAKSIVAINDGVGVDIVNNGKLYISSNGEMNGNGSMTNSANGQFFLRNRAVLQINTVNDGLLTVNSTGIVRNRTLINNKTFVLQDFTLNLIASTFINNDSVSITGTGTTFIADSTLTGGIFQNTATGTITRHSATGLTNFNPSVALTNLGVLKGLGEYVCYNVTAGSTGRIAPGTSPGGMVINPALINGRSPILDFEINSSGAVPGITFDTLTISAVNTTVRNISAVTLRVTDRGQDPVGTVYRIITPSSGTITGTFASVQLSPSLIGPFYNGGNFITVQKSTPLPLTWGDFTATPAGGSVQLLWTTLQEQNTSHFVIEHSVDNVHYSSIDSVNAAGHSDIETTYNYAHNNPDVQQINYYRIRQVDLDRRMTYSRTATVKLGGNGNAAVKWMPNPVTDGIITLLIAEDKTIIRITDLMGRTVKTWSFSKGRYEVSVTDLARGTYIITSETNGIRKDAGRMVKK